MIAMVDTEHRESFELLVWTGRKLGRKTVLRGWHDTLQALEVFKLHVSVLEKEIVQFF